MMGKFLKNDILNFFRTYLTQKRIDEIKEFSKQPDIVDRLVKSIGNIFYI